MLTDGGRFETFDCARDRGIIDAEARRFRRSALKQVWKALSDTSKQECWRAGVKVAGHAGTAEAFEQLRNFVETRAAHLNRVEDQDLVGEGFVAMANVVRGARNPKVRNHALKYLIRSTEPREWERRSISWRVDAVIRRELIRALARSAVSALGLTDSTEADTHLMKLALDSTDRRALRYKYSTIYAAKGGDKNRVAPAVDELFTLHVLPPGRVAFALSSCLDEAQSPQVHRADGGPRIERHIRKVLGRARRNFRDEQKWLESRLSGSKYSQAIREADQLADTRLAGFDGQLLSLRDLVDKTKRRRDIDRIEAVLFPNGAHALANANPHDQVFWALDRVDILKRRYSKELKELRLDDHLRAVEEAHLLLQAALERGAAGVGFEKIIRRRAELQTALRHLVASIIVVFPGRNLADRKRQELLLNPIIFQHEQVSSYLQRGEAVRDVDPKKGSDQAPLKEGGGELNAEPEPVLHGDDMKGTAPGTRGAGSSRRPVEGR